jgi:tetratricopeptide (TPR) repeat protein
MNNTGGVYGKGDIIGGEYVVHGTLGRGGFGIVYRVHDKETRQVYALKTFRDEFLADLSARNAFQKEALLWVNLGVFPFIVEALWVKVFSGRLFVAMDYVEPDAEGRVSLHDHLRCGQPFTTERAVECSIQFCLAMEHANARGVKCHRDIKPANILIAKDLFKISDFGLAAAADVAWRSAAMQSNTFATGSSVDGFGFSMLCSEGRVRCGTPGYMPPEVYRGETADVRSDIYSFGLVLWQMAAGSASPPFGGTYRGDIEAYMHNAYEEQISKRVPPVARPMGAVIERCLNPVPSKRYSSFEEVLRVLEPIYRELSGKAVMVPAISENTAWFWNNRGMSLAALGRHQEAIGCYVKALAIDPGEARIWSNKGFALHNLGRHQEAVECYNKALTLNPQLNDVWSSKGASLDAMGCRQEALNCYDNALVTDFRNANTWNNKGTTLNSLGRNDEALGCYVEALAIDPHSAEAWNNKGSSLDALGRHEEAIRHYDKALAIDPRYASAWYNKGASFAAQGIRQEALACYDKALAISPKDATVWYNKGNALDDMGRHEEAIECYHEALAIDPRYAEAWNNKGGALVALGRYGEAVECYEKALAFNPRDAERWFNKAFSEDEIGRSVEAVRSYAKFLELAITRHARQIAHAKERIKKLNNL